LNADTLFVVADIYYQGQYSAVIQDNVYNSVNNYLVNLSKTNFDGILKVSDLETAFRTATGVTDVFLRSVFATPDGGSSVVLVFNAPGITYQYQYTREYTTAAGYIVPVTNFVNNLNFFPV